VILVTKVFVDLKNLKEKSLEVLYKSLTPTGAVRASIAEDSGYNACWIRDGYWVATALAKENPVVAINFYHWVLNVFKKYEWKLDKMIKYPELVAENEVIHPKFDENGNEFDEEWGWNQLDAIGVVLYGITQLEKKGYKVIRGESDRKVLAKASAYLENAWKYHNKDNSVWEEEKEIHAASLAAMIAGIKGLKEIGIIKNDEVTKDMWNFLETYRKIGNVYIDHGKKEFGADLSTMLVWSVGLVKTKDFLPTVKHIEKHLLGDKGGVKRYLNDRYFSHDNQEGQWTLGALWLSQFYAKLFKETGKIEFKNRSLFYLRTMTKAITEDGYLPEQILPTGAESTYEAVPLPHINRYGNARMTPLAWSHAMYLLAVEELGAA